MDSTREPTELYPLIACVLRGVPFMSHCGVVQTAAPFETGHCPFGIMRCCIINEPFMVCTIRICTDVRIVRVLDDMNKI